MNNLDIEQLKTFIAVVDEGTFDAAAEKLFVTPSAVSQRIKALETNVGRILLQRSKPVKPTDSGNELLLLAREVVLLADEFEQKLGDASGNARQKISIAANADSLGTWMVPALQEASEFAYFEVRREDEEYSAELLKSGAVMAAVTSSSKAIQGCRVTKLGAMRYRPLATRTFANRWFPDGPNAQSLERAPVIVFDKKDEFQNRYLKKFLRGAPTPPCHYIPSTYDFANAVMHSMGWGYISDLQYDTLPKNELIEFDPGSSIDITLYLQQWKLSSPALTNAMTTICNYAKRKLV